MGVEELFQQKKFILIFLIIPTVISIVSGYLGYVLTIEELIQITDETDQTEWIMIFVGYAFCFVSPIIATRLYSASDRLKIIQKPLTITISLGINFFLATLISGFFLRFVLSTYYNIYFIGFHFLAWVVGGFLITHLTAKKLISTDSVDSQRKLVKTYSNDHSSLEQPPSSGDESRVCQICRGTIEPGETTILCPRCLTEYHYPHFAEWLKQNGSCPNCRVRVIITATGSKVLPKEKPVVEAEKEEISEVSRLRDREPNSMTLVDAIAQKSQGWSENTFNNISLIGYIVQIFPDSVSPQGHLFRRLNIADETMDVSVQVWGNERMRLLDKFHKGDLVIIKRPKRPFKYHENQGFDFWVHENNSEFILFDSD